MGEERRATRFDGVPHPSRGSMQQMLRTLLMLAAFGAFEARLFAQPQRNELHAAAKPSSDWKSKMLFREQLIAGSAARGCAQTCLHPIDVMRTRLQVKGLTSKLTPGLFAKGVAPQFFLAFPAGALQFAAYEWCKARFAELNMRGSLSEVACGAAGALAASVIRVPQEVLKQRCQADIYPNALAGFKTLITTEGPKGFYKGACSRSFEPGAAGWARPSDPSLRRAPSRLQMPPPRRRLHCDDLARRAMECPLLHVLRSGIVRSRSIPSRSISTHPVSSRSIPFHPVPIELDLLQSFLHSMCTANPASSHLMPPDPIPSHPI
jgi:hypothetical protein